MSRHFQHINRLQNRSTSHILLYHSTYGSVPQDLKIGLHNVTPDVLRSQILWLQKYFDIVSVDALFQDPQAGKVAITFDDGYESVFREAVPVLQELRAPCTIFLNGCSLQGKPFWRDKVRSIINQNRIDDFLAFYSSLHGSTDGMTSENFYRASKVSSVSSKKVDAAIDLFFSNQSISLSEKNHCVRDAATLVRSPLITYGNHTMNHYVLSSLTQEEQRTEIIGNQILLQSLDVPLSALFSIPFGAASDFNHHTLEIAKEAGYAGFLYSRNRINRFRNQELPMEGGLPFAERYMVPAHFAAFQKQLLGMWVRETYRSPSSGSKMEGGR